MYTEGKWQIEDNVVGWMDQPMMSFKLQPNSLRNWEQLSLSYKYFQTRNITLETGQSPPTTFI